MAKCGVQPYDERTRAKLVPLTLIAQELGLSLRTVTTIYKSACTKLRADPSLFQPMLELLQLKEQADRELLQCGSLECNSEFISLFAEET